MKKYIYLIFLGYLFCSTYEVKINLESYEGIRPGTKVTYKDWDAGKVKSISENKDGSYLISLIIYNEIKDIDNSFLFKVKGSNLIVDLDGMENRIIEAKNQKMKKLKDEEEERNNKRILELEIKLAKEAEIQKANTAKINAAKEAKALKIKDEEAKALKIKDEEAKALKIKDEEAKVLKMKAEEDAKVKRIQVAADNSPFNGDIVAIKLFQKNNGLKVDGFWGKGSQNIYNQLINDKEANDALLLKAAEEQTKKLKAAEEQTKKLKAAEEKKALELKNQEPEISSYQKELNLLSKQYDVAPKIRKKLKIKSKYKGSNPVTVKFFINKKGRAEQILIKISSGNEKFDKSVISAIKKSRWKPAVKNNKSVGVWHQLEVQI